MKLSSSYSVDLDVYIGGVGREEECPLLANDFARSASQCYTHTHTHWENLLGSVLGIISTFLHVSAVTPL